MPSGRNENNSEIGTPLLQLFYFMENLLETDFFPLK